MPLIYPLKDIGLLKVVKSAVLTAKNADELIDIIKKFDATPAPRCPCLPYSAGTLIAVVKHLFIRDLALQRTSPNPLWL